jgi:HEPN domain-containing protein
MTETQEAPQQGQWPEGFADNVLREFVRLFYEPELNRRRERGEIPDDFYVWAAQAILEEDKPPVVRFNEEVRGETTAVADRPIKAGEQVLASDLRFLKRFELDAGELDCGHATAFQIEPGQWFISFNFLYGRAKARDFAERAEQFLEAAEFSIGKGHVSPAADNLFSACELIAKAYLLMHLSPAAKQHTHGSIHTAINNARRLGNVPDLFMDMFNELATLREAARYRIDKPVDFPEHGIVKVRAALAWLRMYWKPLSDDLAAQNAAGDPATEASTEA